MLSISIVSHGHGEMVAALLRDLDAVVGVPFKVFLTLNIPEPEVTFPAALSNELRYPLHMLHNAEPRGFAANHNAAFRLAGADSFCVLNPDVRLRADPFPALLAELGDARVGVVAPLVVDPEGQVEANARRFPTPMSILHKALLGEGREYTFAEQPLAVDWVSGTFMVLGADAYRQVGGFDERYFLYYEDVDLCARLRSEGYVTRLVPIVQAVHAARHDSHRQWRYMRWHLASMLRYFRTRY